MDDALEELLATPLLKLRIGAKLRRKLINLGFASLKEVLAADMSRLEDELGQETASELAKLLTTMEKNPSATAERLMSEPTKQEIAHIKRTIAEARPQRIGTAPISGGEFNAHESSHAVILPDATFVSELYELEELCKRAVVSLADHAEEALLAECFPKISLKVDELSCNVRALVNYYDGRRKTVDAMRKYFPNCLLLFIAGYASRNFDGDSLWEKMFEYLGMNDNNTQTSFKKAFYCGLKDRYFMVFDYDETATHYRSTALLHGGFSKSFWRPLWRNALLPYAKETKGNYPPKAAKLMIRSLKSDIGSYQVGRAYANDVIGKAPVAMLEPLIESALELAADIVDINGNSLTMANGTELLSTHGLPDAAMQALREVLEGSNANSKCLYLPSAELILDPAAGEVNLHWEAQAFPASFAGRSIEYRVNGELRHSESFKLSVGKCILEECNIPVRPNTRFDIELSVLEKGEDCSHIAPAKQSFSRTRPGCLEFILSGDGQFKLRKPSWKLKRKSTIAYLTKPNFTVEPGMQMTASEVYDGTKAWEGASIQVFEVEPSASASLVNTQNGDVVASWQEGFKTSIDRSGCIGKAQGSHDLYGFSGESDREFNSSLPVISIDVPDTSTARNELEISCVCDGRRVSPYTHIEEDYDGHICLKSGTFIVSLPKTYNVPFFSKNCRICIKQPNAGATLLDYKFSIVPISGFGIEDAFWRNRVPMATYGFNACQPLSVPDELGDYEMVPGDRYMFDTPLAKASMDLELKMADSGESLRLALSLAAIDIIISQSFADTALKRPFRQDDGDTMDGRIQIRSAERRHTRQCAALIGSNLVLYRKLLSAGSYTFDIFGKPDYFRFDGKEETKPVKVKIAFGAPQADTCNEWACADLEIASVVTGLGIGELKLRNRQGKLGLLLENPAPGDLIMELYNERGVSMGSMEIPSGTDFVPLPTGVRYALDVKKKITTKIIPTSLFGEPDEKSAITIKLNK